MTTKDNKKEYTTSSRGSSDPAIECGPGMHWDEASQTCVSDTDEQAEVMIYAQNFSSDSDESAAKK